MRSWVLTPALQPVLSDVTLRHQRAAPWTPRCFHTPARKVYLEGFPWREPLWVPIPAITKSCTGRRCQAQRSSPAPNRRLPRPQLCSLSCNAPHRKTSRRESDTDRGSPDRLPKWHTHLRYLRIAYPGKVAKFEPL